MIWLSWTPPPEPDHAGAIHFAGAMLAMGGALVLMALYCRSLARDLSGVRYERSLRIFNRILLGARIAIPLWFAAMVYGLDFPHWVREAVGPLAHHPLESPGFLIGTTPALLAWMGLWWASYPAEIGRAHV